MSGKLKGLLSLPQQANVNRSKGEYEAIVLTAINTVVRRLNISKNRLESLGTLHDHAPLLSYLSASNNALTHAGIREVHRLKKLVTLILSLNKIEQIPKSLSKLPNLQALILNGNLITKLPALEIPTLTALVLSKNEISVIPAACLAGLPSLTKLSLSHNKLTEFPDVSRNRALRELRLNGNELTSVPALTENEELVQLDVGSNKIRNGWSDVALTGPKLKHLSLRGNCPELDVPSDDLHDSFPLLMTYNDKVIGTHNIERNKKRKEWVSKWKQEHGHSQQPKAKVPSKKTILNSGGGSADEAVSASGSSGPDAEAAKPSSTSSSSVVAPVERQRSDSVASSGSVGTSQLSSMLLRPPRETLAAEWSQLILKDPSHKASGSQDQQPQKQNGGGENGNAAAAAANRSKKRKKQRKRRERARSRSNSQTSVGSANTEASTQKQAPPKASSAKASVKNNDAPVAKKPRKSKEEKRKAKAKRAAAAAAADEKAALADVAKRSGIKAVEVVHPSSKAKKKKKNNNNDKKEDHGAKSGSSVSESSTQPAPAADVFKHLEQDVWGAASSGWD